MAVGWGVLVGAGVSVGEGMDVGGGGGSVAGISVAAGAVGLGLGASSPSPPPPQAGVAMARAITASNRSRVILFLQRVVFGALFVEGAGHGDEALAIIGRELGEVVEEFLVLADVGGDVGKETGLA